MKHLNSEALPPSGCLADHGLQRREWLQTTAAAVVASALPWQSGAAESQPVGSIGRRAIPSSGEQVPLVGLGSWITFNVGNDPRALDACVEVTRAFFAHGGRLIDSSPMYGSSQPTIGRALMQLGRPAALFSAEKVWVGDAGEGAAQIEASRHFWGVPRFDLMQVHNLLAWQEHLPRLFEMKAAGRLRYIGITTSHGRRHEDLAQIMASQPLDFVQLTYNLQDRAVEQRLLSLAAERGIAVIVNRPYRGGSLARRLQGKRLPGWAADIDCTSWAQAALKFVIAHPAVTCAIPATSQVAHVIENLGAARGRLPDAALRARMAADAAKWL